MPRIVCLIQLGLAICLLPISLAQTPADAEMLQVEGTVRDPQGYPVPGAIVVISGDPDFSENTVTDSKGNFGTEIGPGRYRLRVEMPGFRVYEETMFLGRTPARLNVELTLDTRTEEVVVRATVPDWSTGMTLGRRQVEEQETQDLAELLRHKPGTAAVRRGPINLEPSIRGLQEGQIGMFVDRTRTFAAGPARMDSDISHVSPHIVQSIQAIKGPSALSWGAGTLSALQVETFRSPFYDDEFQLHGKVGYRYGSNAVAQDGYGSFWVQMTGSGCSFSTTVGKETIIGVAMISIFQVGTAPTTSTGAWVSSSARASCSTIPEATRNKTTSISPAVFWTRPTSTPDPIPSV